MQAIRLHPAAPGTPAYSPANPAPPSALHLDTVPVPKPSKPGEVLVKIRSSTVIRDTLTWPETYAHEYLTPGHDLSGVVVDVFEAENSRFKAGDQVLGMLATDRPGAWAEYAIALEDEIAPKPETLAWEEAAALPLSGLTAFEALFVHAGVPVPGDGEAVRNANAGNSQSREGSGDGAKKVLVTGAAGAVGAYVVQLARLAGLHVTAATSSNARNDGFLRDIGASECVEYFALRDDEHQDAYDIVIDTVGGQPLVDAWKCVRNDDGCLVSVDSSSYNFLEEHAKRGITRDGVKALFFIVQGSQGSLGTLARWAGLGLLRVFVLDTYPLEKAQEAYERANGRLTGRGKIVLSS